MQKIKIFKVFAIIIFSITLSGCLTNWFYLIQDHTLGLVSSPVTATSELLWRVKTFTGETFQKLKVTLYSFPKLDDIKIPQIDPNRPMMKKERINKWLTKNFGQSVSADLKLLIHGKKFFPRFHELIKKAKKSININTYIFDNDESAKKTADILKEKSKSVKVKILLDIHASRDSWKNRKREKKVYKKQQKKNVKNMVSYLKSNSKIKVRRTRNIWLSSDHVKMIIIDKNTAFFGGMNFGGEYSHEWRDMMFEVTGPVLWMFEKYFKRSWNRTKVFSDFYFIFDRYKRKRLKKKKGKIKCHVLVTTPFRHQIYRAQLYAARKAKHHIYVENCYIWNTRFLYALCEARKRGVDVRVTLPSKIDFELLHGATHIALNTLLSHGVRVFIYPGMTHVKAATFDNWACFGTANYDDLSMHKNFEFNLATSDEGFVKKLEEELLLKGQNLSKEITEPVSVDFTDSLSWQIVDFL